MCEPCQEKEFGGWPEGMVPPAESGKETEQMDETPGGEDEEEGEKWEMKGSITGSGKAEATVFGLGNSVLYFTLKGNTLSYTWEWGKGKLTK